MDDWFLRAEDGDDRMFLAVAERLIGAIEQRYEALVVVRIRDWFDHKWLRFSGKGRVPFEGLERSHPGVALDTFWQSKLTFPPFSPRRVVVEEHFAFDDAPDVRQVHRKGRRHSAANLQRRVEQHASSLLAIWVSTGSDLTGRASFMAYSNAGGELTAWYASFSRAANGWALHGVKGVAREDVLRWIGDAAAPLSGVRES